MASDYLGISREDSNADLTGRRRRRGDSRTPQTPESIMSSVLSTKADRDRALESTKIEREMALQQQKLEDEFEVSTRQQLINIVMAQNPNKPLLEVLREVEPALRDMKRQRQVDLDEAEDRRRRKRTRTVTEEPRALEGSQATEESEDIDIFRA